MYYVEITGGQKQFTGSTKHGFYASWDSSQQDISVILNELIDWIGINSVIR